jgi:hypothetical protein
MLRRLIHDEDGVALVMALMIVTVLSTVTAAALLTSAVNHRSAFNSAAAMHAFALAEDGLATAEGRLYSAADNSATVTVPSSWTYYSLDGGWVCYQGSLSGSTWTLTGVGIYPGVGITPSSSTCSAAGTGAASRTVSAQAIVPPPVFIPDPTIWKYVYANATGPCAVTVGGTNVTIQTPIYSQGGVCINGTNAVFSGSDLEVGGDLSLSGGHNTVGTSSAPISKMNVVGSCPASPCNGSTSPVYVTSPGVGNTLSPSLALPPLNLAGYYASTNPGPASGHACPAGSNVPSNFFDSNTTLNNSLSSVNLFPATAYDCIVGSNEIKWTPSTQTLLVNGTFYFDGSLALSNVNITYSGRGVLYFTGTINATGTNLSFCGDPVCANWNPNTSSGGVYNGNELIMVAGCWANSPEANPASPTLQPSCVNLTGTNLKWQIGLYATQNVTETGTNLQNYAPVVANQVNMAGTNTSAFQPFFGVPIGTPATMTAVTPVPGAPTNWSG